MKYYMNKELELGFEESIEKVKQSLMNHGFGVITEIMMHEKLKEKLNVDFGKYAILGACNPSFAHQALQVEINIGTMLPCNVIVRETAVNKSELSVINPVLTMDVIDNKKLGQIAQQVKDQLQLAINEL